MDCKTAIAIADMYIMAGDILRAVGCPKGAGVGWDDGAYRASNDAAVSIVPPKMPYGGFSLGTAPKLACQTGPSLIARRLRLLPSYPSLGTSLPPSFVLSAAA
jgi:hypothetical protein